MNKKTTFYCLNEQYLIENWSLVFPEDISYEISVLTALTHRYSSPEQIILTRASEKGYCPKDLLSVKRALAALHKLFSSKRRALFNDLKNDNSKNDESVLQLFQHRSSEEWCLIFLEAFANLTKKGKFYIAKMIEENLFQEDATVLLNKELSTGQESELYFRLTEHFKSLKMTEINWRRTKSSFKETIVEKFKKELDPKVYKYFADKFKSSDFVRNWYIFDIPLFTEKVLEDFDKTFHSLKTSFKLREDVLADFIFVCVLLNLFSGTLKTWSEIHKIDFIGCFKELFH